MKTITVCLFNRPNYTKILIEHLSRCIGIENYLTIFCVEPGDQKVIKLANDFEHEKEIIIHKERLGCYNNTHFSLDRGFERSDYSIHLEDDTIPSKDTLLYFEWAEKYKDDKDIFTVSGYNRDTNPVDVFPDICKRRSWFHPWGWATWKDRYEEIKEERKNRTGKEWDHDMTFFHRKERKEIYPLLSRFQNIGAEKGTYVPCPEWHKVHQYTKIWAGFHDFTIKQYKEIQ